MRSAGRREVRKTSEAIEAPLALSAAIGDRFKRKPEWLHEEKENEKEKDKEAYYYYEVWLTDPFDR